MLKYPCTGFSNRANVRLLGRRDLYISTISEIRQKSGTYRQIREHLSYTPMVVMRKWNYAAFKCKRKTYELIGRYLDLPWIQVGNKIWKYTLKNKG